MKSLRRQIISLCKYYGLKPLFKRDGHLFKNVLNEIDWWHVSQYYLLSEELIREFKYYVDWDKISEFQPLSESFIEEYSHLVRWTNISLQNLSESFIKKHAGKLNWETLSRYSNLSENLIRDYASRVNWYDISIHQKLSENFIKEFSDQLFQYTENLLDYQKLSKKFRIENFNIRDYKRMRGNDWRNWLYKPVNFKLNYIKKNTEYEVIDNKYITAYKAVRSDWRSDYAPAKFRYKIGETYESNCDYNCNEQASFGLAAWTKKRAIEFIPKGILLKVKIDIKNIGAIVQDDQKIRCRKLTIISRERKR